ncbi:phosphatase PAP2 family protein [Actinomadura atramentaria]|uniref:phosphatase PAP2 family protein n=1 Tax=Actinomadura atramentaria TaxID=1990 RepID=UPI00036328A1|nr:phosphatase PAP2 family protein [Actinomadura atramentaria]
MTKTAGAPEERRRDPSAGPGRGPGRLRLWPELLLVSVCYAAYSTVRNLVPTDHAGAVHRAYELLAVEYRMHVDVEAALNHLFVAHTPLAVAANYFYGTLHFVVTIGVLVWLYARRPHRYTALRTLLFATTVLGLVGFWLFPLAPPRMLPGFVDTVPYFGTWGIYDSGPTASVTNQYAAMPSLHTAWSLWCAICVAVAARRVWLRALAFLYPAATVLVIMGTANHFVLDAVGGAATLATAAALVLGVARTVPAAARAPGHSAP